MRQPPLCGHHHHAVHDTGWTLVLDTDRNLTVTLPDGTTLHATPNRAEHTQHLAAASLGGTSAGGTSVDSANVGSVSRGDIVECGTVDTDTWGPADDLRLEATLTAAFDAIIARNSQPISPRRGGTSPTQDGTTGTSDIVKTPATDTSNTANTAGPTDARPPPMAE